MSVLYTFKWSMGDIQTSYSVQDLFYCAFMHCFQATKCSSFIQVNHIPYFQLIRSLEICSYIYSGSIGNQCTLFRFSISHKQMTARISDRADLNIILYGSGCKNICNIYQDIMLNSNDTGTLMCLKSTANQLFVQQIFQTGNTTAHICPNGLKQGKSIGE